MQAEVRQTPSRTFSNLCDVDFDFGTIETNDGEKPLSQSTFGSFLIDPDRKIREQAYRQFYSVYNQHKTPWQRSMKAAFSKTSILPG